MIKAVKAVVIATEDPVVINQINNILLQHGYSVTIEKSTIKSILKILEQEIEFLILDIDFPQNSNLDLIDIIRRTRPRLPVVVLSKDTSLKTVKKLAEIGVFYCALKPIQTDEIEKVIKAIKRLNQKQEQTRNFNNNKSIEKKLQLIS